MPTRLNRWLAGSTELSRRAADAAIAGGRVTVNGAAAIVGMQIEDNDRVELDGVPLKTRPHRYVMLNKPVGYVCSRRKQGQAPTVYELLPMELQPLNSIGRLDKDSSGLLLLTDDGDFANLLTHPRHQKSKLYEVTLNKSLANSDSKILEEGVQLDDGISRLGLSGNGANWRVSLAEGRNRQIRRTFQALGYTVIKLHRTQFGQYLLGDLKAGQTKHFSPEER